MAIRTASGHDHPLMQAKVRARTAPPAPPVPAKSKTKKSRKRGGK